jgi:RND family efflux transporter MFP subunit
MTRYKTIIWVLAVIVVLALFAVYKHAGFHPATPSADQQSGRRIVAVAQVIRKNLTHRISFTAELEPYQDVNLYGKAAGYLKTINVDIGDQVRTGEVIATLDMSEQEAELAQARAAAEKARLDYERLNGVAEKKPGLIAQQDVDDVRIAYAGAKAHLQYAQVIVDYGRIVAPFSGVITHRYADPGALIQSGISSDTQATPVVRLAENTLLRLNFPVPESIVPQVKRGLPVTVQIDSTGQTLHSVIARLADRVDDTTRTMNVEVDINNADRHLTSGMFGQVTLNLDAKQDVLAVPVQAVAGKEKPTVWVVNAKHQLEERAVMLGLQTPDSVEILSGVHEGEWVVFGSRSGLSPGATVESKPMEITSKS